MLLQVLFVLSWALTTAYVVMPGSKPKTFFIEAGLSCLPLLFAFFLLQTAAPSLAPFCSVLVFRLAHLALHLRRKTAFYTVFRIVSLAGFDLLLLPLFRETLLSAETLLIVYVLLYCLLLLTPYRETRHQTVDWLGGASASRKAAALLLSLVSPAATAVTLLLLPEGDDLLCLLAAALLALLAAAMLLFGEFLCRCWRLEELNAAMTAWHAGAREYMNTIRSQRHDFNLHMHTISGLISGGKFEECRNYVQILVDEAEEVNELMPIYDAVIGSMLAEMRGKAKQKGVAITYSITYDLRDILCDAYQCNKIIGNLIQNAIDACNTEEEKRCGIAVSITKRHGSAVISVENYCEQVPAAVEQMFRLGFSTKKGHEGVGLAMVERTLRRCSGKISVELDGGVICFRVYIPIRFTEEGENEACSEP